MTAGAKNGVCQQFETDGDVCPAAMRRNLFITSAVDNIDYNPSSATPKDSFHGTGISLMQHTTHEFLGDDRGITVIDKTSASTRVIRPHPHVYSSVQPAALKTKQFTAPAINDPAMPSVLHNADRAVGDEMKWLETVNVSIKKQSLRCHQVMCNG